MGKDYTVLGQLFLGGNTCYFFEGLAKIKNSVNSKEELTKCFINYLNEKGYKVIYLNIDDSIKEPHFFNLNGCFPIEYDDISFHFSIMINPIIGDFTSFNEQKEDNNDIFACYKTVTEIDKDGRTIITSYKESQCFKDEVSATAFIECEIKHLIFEDIIRFVDTEKKSSYLFNPQNREWIYTKYSTEVGNRSLTRIEFTVEYIGKLFS